MSHLAITAERLEKMKPVITSGQGHPLAASLMSLATSYDIGARACRIVQRLAEMGPPWHDHECCFCGALSGPHKSDCLWLLARQLADKTE